MALILTVGIFTGCGKEMTQEEIDEQIDQYFQEGMDAVNQNDMDAAIKAFKKASKLGSVVSCYNLGVIYETEKEDYPEALKWYLKGAEKGHANSQFRAYCFYNYGPELGKGLKQDSAEADKWFKKALEQGQENAVKIQELKRKQEENSREAEKYNSSDWIKDIL